MVAVVLILVVSAAIRLSQLSTPPEYMFDEVYYAKDAKAMIDGRVGRQQPLLWASGDVVSWPHPEMGKLAIAGGIALFGDRAFGWRFPAVVAGMVLLACVYPIARRLGLSPEWSVIALLLAAADPLGMTQSRIATLDIFVAMWSVLCLLFALRYVQDERRERWMWLCGLTGGMAFATKWSGALAVVAAAGIILFCWFRDRRAAAAAAQAAEQQTRKATTKKATALPARSALRAICVAAVSLVALPIVLYVASYTQYFLVGHHPISDWIELQRQALHFNFTLSATHTYASAAPTWIINYRPVWYYFNSANNIYRGVVAMGNPFLWWSATLLLIATPILAIWRRAGLLLAPAILAAVMYLPWFATSRTSFLYYMTPIAPLLAILVAAGLAQFVRSATIERKNVILMAAVATVTAALWYPIGAYTKWLLFFLPEHYGTIGIVMSVAAVLAIVAGVALVLIKKKVVKHPSFRMWMAMLAVGCIAGICFAFLPMVMGVPVSPQLFSHSIWFPSWI